MGSVYSEQNSKENVLHLVKESTVTSTNETKKMMNELSLNPAKNIQKNGNREIGVPFYLIQSRHILEDNNQPFSIGYTINNDVQLTWHKAATRAIKIVNTTCPGINIIKDNQKEIAKQIIFKSSNKKEAKTQNNILTSNQSIIVLGIKWYENARNGTALHELLHALGVQHEHKRNDRHKFGVDVNNTKCIEIHGNEWNNKWKYQYTSNDEDKLMFNNGNDNKIDDIDGITMYDAHSIMNYVNCKGKLNIDKDLFTVYSAYSPLNGFPRRDILSPLDEVGLNILYKPCIRSWYKPIQNNSPPPLFYCGRNKSTLHHNYPANDINDGKCGPNNGGNCSACRVLKNDDIPKYNDQSNQVWQGSSGFFYCGKQIGIKKKGHDGYCGPNNGIPCISCKKLVGWL